MTETELTVFEQVAKLRELLWLNHGCPVGILYGDDGELQCPKCMLDFKRDTVERIEETWLKKNHDRAIKFFEEEKERERERQNDLS